MPESSQQNPGEISRALHHQVDQLTAALRLWDNRDEDPASSPQPEVTEAGNDALAAIDAMLRQLNPLRTRLVNEQRLWHENRDRVWRAQQERGPIDGGSGPFWTPPVDDNDQEG